MSKNVLFCSFLQIVTRCDICLLQEVRDQKNKAIPRLLNAVNRLTICKYLKKQIITRCVRSDLRGKQIYNA